ncbi:hypothetical protein BgiBS90_032227 [Biomphalaria glabrata]|nr:hypothetical protein BgiBS90_032227 [Biomphalaria glabrata]
MTLHLLTVVLLLIHGLATGIDVTDNEQTGNELKEAPTTALQEIDTVDNVNEDVTLARNKKALMATLKFVVDSFCKLLKIFGGRSIRDDLDLDLTEKKEIQTDKRALTLATLVTVGKVICTANTAVNILNNVRNFCRVINAGKRDIQSPESVIDEEEHQPEKRNFNWLLNSAREICKWLDRIGRDTENVEDLYSGTEYQVDRRDFKEIW